MAKEMLARRGIIEQTSADNYESLYIPIDQPTTGLGKFAWQLYQIDFSFDEVRLMQALPASPGCLFAMVSKSNQGAGPNDVPLAKQNLLRSEGTASTRVTMCNIASFSWKAPPSLLVARKALFLEFGSLNTGEQNILMWAIYYKRVAITDLQYLQLSRDVT